MSLKLYEKLSELIFANTNHAAAIGEIYEQMTPLVRFILYEREVKGRKYAEIGRDMDLSKQTVERMRFDALVKISKKVKSLLKVAV